MAVAGVGSGKSAKWGGPACGHSPHGYQPASPAPPRFDQWVQPYGSQSCKGLRGEAANLLTSPMYIRLSGYTPTLTLLILQNSADQHECQRLNYWVQSPSFFSELTGLYTSGNQMAFCDAKTGQYMLSDSPGDLTATETEHKEGEPNSSAFIPSAFSNFT